jgi:hypothetical protein
MKNLDYMQDLEIDQHKLDQEWLRQPTVFMAYSEAAVMAEDERDRCKRALEVAVAEADQSIRKAALDAQEKVTEAVVAHRVTLHPSVDAAERSFLEANTKAKLLAAAPRAFDQRKKALEKLSELFIAGYFSAPRGDKTEKTSKIMNEKLQEKY